MPRGGYRENAGKKSTWGSGRSFAETKVIRVPTEFAHQLLEMAHKLDAGESIDLVTSSIDSTSKEEIESLTEQIEKLQSRINQMESRLDSDSLKEKRDRALGILRLGSSAPQYKTAAKVLNAFIKSLTE